MRTVSRSPGRVEGRSGSSRADADALLEQAREAAQGEDAAGRRPCGPGRRSSRGSRPAASPRRRAGERGQDPRVGRRAARAARARRCACAAGAARPGSARAGAIAMPPGSDSSAVAHPEHPARERVGGDVPVAHPEERGAQRGHQRHAVGRIVHRAQHGQRLVHLLAVEERLAALHGEAQAGGLQRVLEVAHLAQAPAEDHHVPGRARRGRSPVTRSRTRLRPRGHGRDQPRPAPPPPRAAGPRLRRSTALEAQRDHRRRVVHARPAAARPRTRAGRRPPRPG